MFSIKSQFRMVFFDRSIIRRNWRNINEGPLKKAGLLVRKIARNSIRRVNNPNRYSPPGTPPYSHANRTITGRRVTSPPFKQIYSVPNYAGTNVTVGMVWYGSQPPIPGLHELGGYARRGVFRVVGTRTLKSGLQGGPITKRVFTTVRYPARPFMRPALAKALPTLPLLWRNSLYTRGAA